MASVEIFVDDAVRGNLPFVCAKTGEPADGIQRIEQKIGGLSPLVALLVFVPVVGWVALLVLLAVSHRRATLTVRLPISRGSLAVQQYWRRWWIAACVATCACFAAVLARLTHESPLRVIGLGVPPFVWFVLACAAFAVAIAAYAAMYTSMVRVRLDASRRWVTLSGVDPRFRDAVLDQQRGISEPHPA